MSRWIVLYILWTNICYSFYIMTEYRRLCNNIWPIFYTIKITKARIFTISPKIVENCRDTVYCIINQLYNLKYILSWYRLSYNICIQILAGYKLDTPPPSIKVEIDCIDKTCTQRKPSSLPVQTQWDTSKPSKGPL